MPQTDESPHRAWWRQFHHINHKSLKKRLCVRRRRASRVSKFVYATFKIYDTIFRQARTRVNQITYTILYIWIWLIILEYIASRLWFVFFGWAYTGAPQPWAFVYTWNICCKRIGGTYVFFYIIFFFVIVKICLRAIIWLESAQLYRSFVTVMFWYCI